MTPNQDKSTGIEHRDRMVTRRWLLVFSVIIIAAGLFAAFVGAAKRIVGPPVTWSQVLGPPASQSVDESKPLGSQVARVELGGRVFEIPLMYIDSRKEPGGVYRESILLEVIWPDMRSIYELKDKQEYERIWKHERRRGWILIHPAAEKPSLDEQIENNYLTHAKTELVGSEGGLEMFRWYHGSTEKFILSDEVYLRKAPDGQVVDYIRCDAPSRGSFPQCSHQFVDGGLMYQISYNKAALFLQWQEQRHRAIDFLHRFEVTSSNHQQNKG